MDFFRIIFCFLATVVNNFSMTVAKVILSVLFIVINSTCKRFIFPWLVLNAEITVHRPK